MDVRWTMKRVKMRKSDGGGKSGEGGGGFREPKHGYENHVPIDRKWRLVRLGARRTPRAATAMSSKISWT